MRLKHVMKGLLGGLTGKIKAGPLQGRRWLVASGVRFMRGTYEPHQSEAFRKLIAPGNVVFDVGAHVGYYTVVSSLLVGAQGKVVAFEPLPTNLQYLRRHLALNGCGNVEIFENCLADRASVAHFDDSRGSGVGRLASEGTLEVQVRSLDEMVEAGDVPVPNFIKIDVEGAEMLVLAGAERLLTNSHPTIVLSTHSDELDRDCEARLRAFGYEVEHLERDVLLAKAKAA